MPAAFGIEYWALWAEEYVALFDDPSVVSPNAEMAKRHNIDPGAMGTIVTRLRNRYGLITPFISHRDKPQLTHKAMELLGIPIPVDMTVKFTAEIEASSKVRALAQAWDIVQQLEHWDERSGKPFTFEPGRLRELG